MAWSLIGLFALENDRAIAHRKKAPWAVVVRAWHIASRSLVNQRAPQAFLLSVRQRRSRRPRRMTRAE